MTYSSETRQKLRRGAFVVTALVVTMLGTLQASGALDWLENRSSDWRVRATLDPSRADRDIVLIDIDNASFRTLTDQLGRWPWTRKLWAALLRFLTPGKPSLVIFDAQFTGPEPDADADFASAIRSAGNVVLPFAFVAGKVGSVDEIFAPPPAARVQVDGPPRGPEMTREWWSLNTPKQFEKHLAATGSNLWTPDRDGVTRRLPILARFEGRTWASLWFAAAAKLRGASGARFEGHEFVAGPIRVPVDSNGNFVVRWHGDTLTAYRAVPLWEVICSMWPDNCETAKYKHKPSDFTGKIVIIGASAAGSYEVRPTPVTETASGFFTIATAIDNLLHNQAIRQTPLWGSIALVFLFSGIPSWAVLQFRSIAASAGISLGLVAAHGALALWLYNHSFWLTMSAPMLAAVVSFGANTAFRYFSVDRELGRTRGTLERYVSPQLVRYVMEHLDSFRFDGEKKKLTVFFSDVRGFTTLTEKSDPVLLLQQLNEYLEAMTDIIFRYDGIVDKFIGDGIMAHWGAFTPDRPNAWLAARASLDMIHRLKQLNEKWAGEGRPPMNIGIGLNTGEVIFGNVGAAKKQDFTAIGDGVNLAARLEGANKEYHTNIILSEATLHELGDAATVRPLGSIVVKGKTVGVEIFELQALEDAPR